jgi:hypothetical protein
MHRERALRSVCANVLCVRLRTSRAAQPLPTASLLLAFVYVSDSLSSHLQVPPRQHGRGLRSLAIMLHCHYHAVCCAGSRASFCHVSESQVVRPICHVKSPGCEEQLELSSKWACAQNTVECQPLNQCSYAEYGA